MTKLQRRYLIALIVLAFLFLISIGEFIVFLRHPPTDAGDAEARRSTFELVIFLSSAYLAVIAMILLIWTKWPVQGRLVITALNVILLLAFPLGTALAVYYLWKVNRSETAVDEAAGAQTA